MTSSGSVSVLTEGYARSEALGRTHTFEVSLVNLAVNVVVATLNVDQSAYIDMAGSLDILGGSLNVRSEIYSTGDFGKAVATVGGSGGGEKDSGVSLSLVGVTVNEAISWALSSNKAYIAGTGSIAADSINVKAKTVSESDAAAKSGGSLHATIPLSAIVG
jgi:hypothetical protein